MLIKALMDYYDLLMQNNEVLKEGYSKQSVHYTIFLNKEGSVEDIISCQEEIEEKDRKGKIKFRKIPREIKLPKRTEKPGIDLNIIEHRPVYIFGLNYNKKENHFCPEDATHKAQKSHQCFVKGNLAFIEGLHSEIIDAYRNFLLTWNPEEESRYAVLEQISSEYDKSYFEFALSGHPEIKLHEDLQILKRWEEYLKDKQTDHEGVSGQCLITGENSQMARIHPKIKGIAGGQASGCVLVGVNNKAEESYGKEQGYNCYVSQSCARQYAEALNYLLKQEKHKSLLGNMTICYWSTEKERGIEQDLLNSCFNMNVNQPDEMDRILNTTMGRVKQGLKSEIDNLDIDNNLIFFIAAFAPNSSRLAIKWIYQDSFGNIYHNIIQHQKDMMHEYVRNPVSLNRMLEELVSPKSKDEKPAPPLISGIMSAIFTGKAYPQPLLTTMIRRIKVDSDTDKNTFIKLNEVRIGIIKACINRKDRLEHKREEIKMALDKNNKDSAYLCGRLFALLEKVQKEAAGAKLNRTIKDAYFASACSNPATVFPRLLKLSQNHLSKLGGNKDKEGLMYHFSGQIGEIMGSLEQDFPKTLNLQQQGKFIIGYYQQMYAANEKKQSESVAEKKSLNEEGGDYNE